MSTPFFDTNIIIDWLQDRPGAATELERYAKHRISRIVWSEVIAGEPLETRRKVQDLLSPFEIVELDARIGDAAADIRYRAGQWRDPDFTKYKGFSGKYAGGPRTLHTLRGKSEKPCAESLEL